MAEQQQDLAALYLWMRDTPLLQAIWAAQGQTEGRLGDWCEQVLQAALASGVLVQRGTAVHDH